jgi:predicted transcriptional regulator
MISALKDALKAAEIWPEEDQEALVPLREIEAQRSGVYEATLEELAAVDRSLADARAGRIASEEEVNALKAKFRGV